MNFRKKGLSCEEARKLDMVVYLSSLGIEPVKIRGNDYWYLSPLRIEKTASFKINRKMNAWYDHGIGKGGNIIDFATLHHDCTVAEFLRLVGDPYSFYQPFVSMAKIPPVPESKIEVLQYQPLVALELLRYLQERRIPQAIACQYCGEVSYRFTQKEYYGIGFRNDLGGFEIRNRYFKGSSSPKGITHLKNGGKTLIVFEGFFDFLSYLTITAALDQPIQDYLILNGLAFVELALPILHTYELVRLFLDNDRAGQNASSFICSQSEHFQDESSMYQRYKDLSDFLNCKPVSEFRDQTDIRQQS